MAVAGVCGGKLGFVKLRGRVDGPLDEILFCREKDGPRVCAAAGRLGFGGSMSPCSRSSSLMGIGSSIEGPAP